MQTIEHKQRDKIGVTQVSRVMLSAKEAHRIAAFQKEEFADLVQVVTKLKVSDPLAELIPKESAG